MVKAELFYGGCRTRAKTTLSSTMTTTMMTAKGKVMKTITTRTTSLKRRKSPRCPTRIRHR